MLRRSRARFFGVLALAAIAMQMALSFTHTHVGAGQVAGLDATSVRCLDNTGVPCAAPAHHPADRDQDEAVCLICLTASQTAATVLWAAHEVACPLLTPSVFKRLRSAPAHGATKTANFYARGPPAA